jgi:hypothetical protein
MEEKKLYYLGTGTEFVKNQCKEYKTIEGALKAAAKDESLVVWDEDGNIIGSLTDNVPDGALQTNPDGSVDAFVADGNKVGTVDAKSVEEMTGNAPENNAEDGQNGSKDDEQANTSQQDENAENGANGASKNDDDEKVSGGDDENPEDDESHPVAGIIKEQVGRFHVTVVCEGSLRLRRSASWNNSNECGRASKGQTYVGKRLFMLDGLPMLETVDGFFMSAAAEHVKMEKMG